MNQKTIKLIKRYVFRNFLGETKLRKLKRHWISRNWIQRTKLRRKLKANQKELV